jgi:hypothetical protein
VIGGRDVLARVWYREIYATGECEERRMQEPWKSEEGKGMICKLCFGSI